MQELLMVEAPLLMGSGDPRPLRAELAAVVEGRQPATARLRTDLEAAFVVGWAMDGHGQEMIRQLEEQLAHATDENDSLTAASRLSLVGSRVRALDPATMEQLARSSSTLPELPSLLRARQWMLGVHAMARHEQADFEGAIEVARAGLAMVPGALILPTTVTTAHLVRALLALGRVAEARAVVAENRRRIDLFGSVMRPASGFRLIPAR